MKQKTLDLNMLKAVRKEWYPLPEDAIPDNKREAYRMRKKQSICILTAQRLMKLPE